MTINVNCPPRGLFIGRETENVARTLTVDFSAWAAEHGPGTLQVLLQRPGDATPYPVTLTVDGTVATWKPSETDLAEAGTGAVQLVYTTAAGVREKTQIIPVMVEPSLGVESDPPEGWTSWLDQLTDLAAETEQHAANAAQSAENAGDSATDAQRYATDAGDAKNAAVAAAEAAAASASHYPQIVNGVWYVWSPTAGEYISTGIDAQGEDGVSPSVEITAIQGGHRVVITDAEGSHTFDVMDGVTPDLSAYRTAVEQDVIDDAQDDQIADLKSALNTKAGILRDTVSGSVASFVPDSTVPNLLGLSVALEPIQDLHGYDSPWPAGGGKNLLNIPQSIVDSTQTGITIHVNRNADGAVTSIVLNGTATNRTYIALGRYDFPENTILNGCPAGGTYNSYSLAVDGTTIADRGEGYTITEPVTNGNLMIVIARGYTCTNLTFYPMLRLSSVSDASFAPYSNICPISGRESVEAGNVGKNKFNINAQDSFSRSATWYLTNNGDGSITVSLDSNTSIGNKKLKELCLGLTVGEIYTLSAKTTGSNDYIYLYGVNETWRFGAAKRITEAVLNSTVLWYASGARTSATISDIQLEPGSTASEYKPYSGNRYTIQLGDTVYGGTLDAVNGTLTVTYAEYVFTGNEAWQASSTPNRFFVNNMNQYLPYNMAAQPMVANAKQNVISSIFGTFAYKNADGVGYIVTGSNELKQLVVNTTAATTVADINTIITGSQLAYELETPIVIDLDPVTIATIANQTNNVWADAGDVTVEFAADLKTYIDNKIAAAVAALS